MPVSVEITKSTADWVIAIIAAVIATLTFVLDKDMLITVPVVVGAIIVFLTAILNFIKTVETVPEPIPEPVPVPT